LFGGGAYTRLQDARKSPTRTTTLVAVRLMGTATGGRRQPHRRPDHPAELRNRRWRGLGAVYDAHL